MNAKYLCVCLKRYHANLSRKQGYDMPKALHNVQLKSLPFKTLGIWFAKDTEEAATLNYKNTASRAKKNLVYGN